MQLFDIILLLILLLLIYAFLLINTIKNREGFIKRFRQPFRNFRLKRQSFGRNLRENMTRAKRSIFGKGL